MHRTLLLPIAGLACVSIMFIASSEGTPTEPQSKVRLRPAQFEYPNAPASRCSVKTDTHFNALMYTEDGFDKVVSYYQQLTGIDLSAKARGQVRMNYEASGGREWSMFVDDSADMEMKPRPLQMRVLSQDNDSHHLTIVVSRADDEPSTHIWIVYHRKPS